MSARQSSHRRKPDRSLTFALACAVAALAAGAASAQSSYPPPAGQGAPPYQAPQYQQPQYQPPPQYQQPQYQQAQPNPPQAYPDGRQGGPFGAGANPQAAGGPADAGPLQPGEAFVTRFSGATANGAAIDIQGPTGVIIGVANPDEPAQGQHWIGKPMRTAVTAGQVGQVFGVALDDQQPPNVYLTATAAFGLHLQQGVWMPGQWGLNGGPGSVWRLDPSGRASLFADIRLNGRANSGPALGNIAFDRMNRQFFVSDMETGMIHRLSRDGRDLGAFDHGVMARQSFLDAENGQRGSLPPIAFDPSSMARYQNCQGNFDNTPECWNIASAGRRIWGLGVRRDPWGEGARLYYGVWSSPAYGGASAWAQFADDEKRNSVWSVRIGPNGDFDPSDVRREFVMPDFFVNQQDVERAGYSQPVSDIAFSECGERPVMLVSERGGLRNLGLSAENAFATPGESRALRYELDQNGVWRGVGRYDVGNNDRSQVGAPFLRANCAGGSAFGPAAGGQRGAQPFGQADGPAQTVWITGDNLCSPQGPCRLPPDAAPQQASTSAPQGDADADTSQVHGVQGSPADMIAEIVPVEPGQGAPARAGSPALENAWLIDVDQVVDASGGMIEQELYRNDATRVGDIAIYQICAPPPPPPRPVRAGAPWINPVYLIPPPPPNFLVPGHAADYSHARWASHGARSSHYRAGSHDPTWSHQRWRSHSSLWSHNRYESHNQRWSHSRYGSHNRWLSGGHTERTSHWQRGSHSNRMSHNPRLSDGHSAQRSHAARSSHDARRSGGGTHNPQISNGGIHPPSISHSRIGSHNPQASNTHDQRRTHAQTSSQSAPPHNTALSSGHNPQRSSGTHNPAISSGGIHAPALSKGTTHTPVASRGTAHSFAISSGTTHNAIVSRGVNHNPVASRGNIQHNVQLSAGSRHTPIASRGGVQRHDSLRSRANYRQPPRIYRPHVDRPRYIPQQRYRPQQRYTPNRAIRPRYTPARRYAPPRMQRQRFSAPRAQRQSSRAAPRRYRR